MSVVVVIRCAAFMHMLSSELIVVVSVSVLVKTACLCMPVILDAGKLTSLVKFSASKAACKLPVEYRTSAVSLDGAEASRAHNP